MSTLRADTISDAAGPGPVALTKQEAPKYYQQLNMATGSSVTSFNVSSNTDSGVGNFDITVTNSFDIVEYPVLATQRSGNTHAPYGRLETTSSINLLGYNTSGTLTDMNINSAGMGDLA